jgi:predicted TPR repeat methyltransferase
MEAPSIRAAMAHHQRGEIAQAESMYVELLRQQPDDANALHYLGVLRMAQGRNADAVELLQRALEIAPGNAVAWNSLANMLVLCKELPAAEVAYNKATAIQPDFTEAWFNLANYYRNTDQPNLAVQCFQRVIDLKPKFSSAYENIALLLDKMGKPELRIEALRKWAAAEPDNAVPRHLLAAYSDGPAPERAPNAFVTHMFDRFAENFDESLARLEYHGPRLIRAALEGVLQLGQGDLAVLDAGCGTGLGGLELHDSARKLVGVDLSGRMLMKARDRAIYDELHLSELVAFMRARPAAFDLITCVDTFIYFGRLDEAFGAAARALKPGGVLAFTLEAEPAGSASNYRMSAHGQYSHRADYVRACLAGAKLEVLKFEDAVARKELAKDVPGYVVVAKMGTVPYT